MKISFLAPAPFGFIIIRFIESAYSNFIFINRTRLRCRFPKNMQWCGSGVMVHASPMELQLGRTSTKVHRCSETVKTLRQVHHDAEPVFVGVASRYSSAPASASASTASCGPTGFKRNTDGIDVGDASRARRAARCNSANT